MSEFNDRFAVVTGASSGIGLKLTETLLGHGATVLAMARREGPPESLHAHSGKRLHWLAGDVTRERDLDALASRAASIGPVDYLVPNAGIAQLADGLDSLAFEQQWRVNGFRVARFVEKPDQATAQSYLDSGKYLWNAGMFCFQAATVLQELERHAPEVLIAARAALADGSSLENGQCRQRELAAGAFAEAPDISVDYALMERSDKVAVVPCSIGWSDIGSWQALRELSAADENGNQVRGESVLHDVSNCYIDSPKRLVGAVGVHDLIIVDTPDALLVADAARSQDVKFVAQELKRRGHDAFRLHRTVSRPWGTYTVLEEGRRFKIKRIVVRPKASLSLQMHHHRSEHWIVVSGMALVENGEREFLLNTNESTFIPAGHSHRLSNPGIIDLVMIEVQSGEYLGEDDIVRFNDIYGRAPASDEKKA
ncbi:mannose-1-phosphate guanylyltransferase/mannose-6-phosphate isomerase [Pseudomonas aeruginosa]|nr:mannose-1-phosphate guanylyltransferase/mannose-6-phosphate isomerase [Pseudomonas aeruginosa]